MYRLSELLVEFRRALVEYKDIAESYRELEQRLLMMLNEALVDNQVKVKTASDIKNLVEAVTKMMESRAKLTTVLLNAASSMKDIITAQAAAEAVLSAGVSPVAELPKVPVALIDAESEGVDSEGESANSEAEG